MTGLLPCRLLALLLVMTTAAGWAADPRVLIVREDTAVARQAAELLGRELDRMGLIADEVAMGERVTSPRPESEVALLGLGPRAYAIAVKVAGNRPVIGALLTRTAVDEVVPAGGDRWSAILLDQPVDRWLNLIQTAFPSRSQVGMLVGPAGQKALLPLEKKLADRRMSLAAESIVASEDLIPALERLIPRMGVLLALPDPVAHNRNSVQPLLLTTYRAGIPVVAYSEAYQQAGAVLALYSTVPQVVAQVIETLRLYQEGKVPPNVQAPRHYTVGVNLAVARSLGLRLPPASEVLERLKALDQ